jgi:diguanylate cyclase (GGDEF)-like protein/PAS domain S-box-containing protein
MPLLDPIACGAGDSRAAALGARDILAARDALHRAGGDVQSQLKLGLELAARWTCAPLAWLEIAEPTGQPLCCTLGDSSTKHFPSLRNLVPQSKLGLGVGVSCLTSKDLDEVRRAFAPPQGIELLLAAAPAGDSAAALILVGCETGMGEQHREALMLAGAIIGDAWARARDATQKAQLAAERQRLRADLAATDQRFRGIFESAAVGMILTDVGGRFIGANRAFCELLGYNELELLNRDVVSITHPDDRQRSNEVRLRLARGEIRDGHLTKRYVHRDGQDIWVRLGISRLSNESGKPYFLGVAEDITEQTRTQWLERDCREVLEMVAQDQPLPSAFNAVAALVERQITGVRACVLLLHDGSLHPFAPSFSPEMLAAVSRRPLTFASRLMGAEMAFDKTPLLAITSDHPAWDDMRELARAEGIIGSWVMPLRCKDSGGGPVGLLVVCTPHNRPPVAGELSSMEAAVRLATIAVDHHHTTKQLAHLVRHDPLTGLANRIFYQDRLDQALAQARRNGQPLALLALDLNRFKEINDSLGHQAGDSLLQQVAQRLKVCLRESDTIARVGGDEFMVILPDVTSRQGAQIVADKLSDALASAPFEIAGTLVRVGISIGMVLYPEDGTNAVALQHAADSLMYRNKGDSRKADGKAA